MIFTACTHKTERNAPLYSFVPLLLLLLLWLDRCERRSVCRTSAAERTKMPHMVRKGKDNKRYLVQIAYEPLSHVLLFCCVALPDHG